ncbi:MAG: hypothetical protein AAGE96_03410 [Cyanobacteria bacterium P01_G01_bin.19]
MIDAHHYLDIDVVWWANIYLPETRFDINSVLPTLQAIALQAIALR